MPPGGQKRKRGDANYIPDRHDPSQRASPHRPHNLGLAQHGQHQHQQQTQRGGLARRGGGGGRGGRGSSFADGRGAVAPSGPAPAAQPSPAPRPAPAASTPQPPSAPAPPAAPYIRPNNPANVILPSIYRFSYLTDERISAWQESGRQEVVDSAAKELEEGQTPTMLFGELIRAALAERLPAADAGSVVRDVLALPAAEGHDLAEIFLDDVSIAFPPPTSNKPEVAANDIPNPPALRELLIATNIPPELLRQQLEGYVLIACGFVRDTFGSKGIRYQTSELYKQRAYNLLREESEGYAKLLTEYFDASSRPPTSDMVADTYLRVMSLIGTFDLDPGRVLDVTLDAFANTIIRHNRFSVKYLRASSWWPAEGTWPGVKWSDKLVSPLPEWAEPGYDEQEDADAEVARTEELRQRRDVAFWQRVREVGVEAWFELGGRRLLSPDDKALFPLLDHPAAKDDKSIQETIVEILDNNWINATGSLPPQGNRIAAQLLGFKLRFYASSTRDPSDTLPDVLMNLAALLIKVGFISLRDLYPHLYPNTEEEMAKIKAKLQEEKAERERKSKPGGGTNALLAAGALTDDTLPPPAPTRLRDATGNSTPRSNAAGTDTDKAKEEAKKSLPDPDNQIIILLRNLLLIGAIPESLFLLGKFPWFMDLYPDLPRYVHRLFHQMLSKVYEPLQPLRDRPSVRSPKPLVDNEKSGLPKGHISTVTPEARKALRWARLEQSNSEGKDYIFYWDDWADSVPLCQNVDDVFLLCDTFVNISGVKIGQDPPLLAKLARIGKHSLSTDASPENNKRWIELSKRLLVPALSLTKSNSPVVNEIFGVLQVWPIATRFNIYAEWTTGQTSRLPDIVVAVEHARAQTKDVLKRISKTNTRPMARELAKIADSNPGTVFREAFRQIESYQNMIEVFVECARYLPALGYDVLTWALMSSLGGNARSRNQEDGMLTSPWLQALSEFAGSVFKRYPEMHAQSVLQYVAWQLKEGNSTDLVVLEQVIDKLAGIQCDIQMNDYQLQAITGGPLLNKLVMQQLQDKRNDPSFKPGTRRLLNALRLTDEGRPSQLITLLLVLVAQEVTIFPSRDEVKDAPLKVLGINLDRIYHIFRQYLELLLHNLSTEDFDARIPDVVELIEQYRIEPAIAWTIGGRSVRKRVAEISWPPKPLSHGTGVQNGSLNDTEMKEPSSASAADQPVQNGDGHSVKAETPTEANNPSDPEVATKAGDEDVNMGDVPAIADLDTKTQDPTLAAAADKQIDSAAKEEQVPTAELLHPILRSYIDRFEQLLPNETKRNLPVAFYVAFWHLELRDIFVPESAYRDERTRSLKAYEASLKRPLPRVGASRDAKQKQDAELKQVYENWEQEMKREEARCNAIKTRLRYEKDFWFYEYRTTEAHLALHKALWQDCFFPRVLQSGADAHYAFHLMFFLHNSGGTYGKASDGTLRTARPVSGFRLARMLDDIFQGNALMNTIAALTNREAENFGRFLFKLLEKLHSWQKSRDAFENEAHGKERNLTGFTRKAVFGNDPPKNAMSWDDFRTLLARWNSAVFFALKTCLQSKEYMHIRNAILILKQVNPPFPAINFHNSQLKAMLIGLHENDPRPDVKLTAMSCVGDLTKREKFMVSIQNFKGEPEQSKNASAKPSTPRTSTPQPPASSRSLNATASEFKPTTNGVRRPSGAKNEEDDEEGEIDESKKTEEEKKKAAVAAIASAREKKSEEPVKEAPGAPADTPTPAPAPPARTPVPSAAPHTASRPNAGSVAASPIPSRPGSTRPAPAQPSAQSSHALPDRPEVRPSSGRQSDRLKERDHPEYGRLDRPGELVREERRDQLSGNNSRGKSPERGPTAHRDRHEPERRHPPRDPRDVVGDRSRQDRPERVPTSVHTPRDSRQEEPRRAPQDIPASRQPAQAPSAPHPDRISVSDFPHPERTPYNHGNERPAAPQHSRPPLVDESAAFAQRNSRAQDTHRPEREIPPEWAEERAPHPDGPRRDWRDNRYQERQVPPHAQGRDLREPRVAAAPTGPRDPPRGPHDLFGQPSAPPRAPADPNHGRLSHVSQDFAVPPRPNDLSYGRLNSGPPTPTTETPSGPRGRNAPMRATSRVFTASGGTGHPVDGPPFPQSPTHERGTPTGPGVSGRGGRDHVRRGSRDHGPSTRSNPSSAPSTPATEMPPSSANAEPLGIHPSRLRNIDGKPVPTQGGGGPSTNDHVQSHTPSGPMVRGPRGAGLPSGPYNAGPSPAATRATAPQGAPMGPGGNMGPPTPTDRAGRSEGDRRFTGLNNILQQSPGGDGRQSPHERDRERRGRDGERPLPRQSETAPDREPNSSFRDEDRGASIRGRASRQSSFQQDAHPNSMAGGPPPPMPPSGPPNGRADLMDGRGPPPMADYRDRTDQGGRPSRHRESGRHRSRSPGREHGGREEGRRHDERPTRSTRATAGGDLIERDGDGRRPRDDREYGNNHREGGDRRTRGGGLRDEGPAPPPMQMGGRGPPRGDDQHWGDGRNGEFRPPHAGRGGRGGDYDGRGGRAGDGGRDMRKRGRGGDEGPSPDIKRPRRSA